MKVKGFFFFSYFPWDQKSPKSAGSAELLREVSSWMPAVTDSLMSGVVEMLFKDPSQDKVRQLLLEVLKVFSLDRAQHVG